MRQFEVPYEFELAEDITIPANCVLEFNGGSISGAYILTGQRTAIVAPCTQIFKSPLTLGGTFNTDRGFNAIWFGSVNDGITDNTAAIRYAIECISNCNIYNSDYPTWNTTNALYFPSGTYIVESDLITAQDSFFSSPFLFKGENEHGSVIRFLGDTFIYNDNLTGYVTFMDLTISTPRNINNKTLLVMKCVAGQGNPQSFMFEKCNLRGFGTVLKTIGNAMCSEATFNNCKMGYCGTQDYPCNIFDLGNNQGVNIRVFNCDIEVFEGNLVYFHDNGGVIHFYQGSIIPKNIEPYASTFECCIIKSDAEVPVMATFICTRFEMQGYVYLLKEASNQQNNYVFEYCDLGNDNLTNDNNFYPIVCKSSGKLTIRDCTNGRKLKASYLSNSLGPFLIQTDIYYKQLLLNSKNDGTSAANSQLAIQNLNTGVLECVGGADSTQIAYSQYNFVAREGFTSRRTYVAHGIGSSPSYIRDSDRAVFDNIYCGRVIEGITLRRDNVSQTFAYDVLVYAIYDDGTESLLHTFNVAANTARINTTQKLSYPAYYVNHLKIVFLLPSVISGFYFLYDNIMIEGT